MELANRIHFDAQSATVTCATTGVATVAEPGAPVAPEKATSKKDASPKDSAPKAKQGARAATPAGAGCCRLGEAARKHIRAPA